ncbi:unnamed protein product [Cylindrotheca closterium]|uniref:Sulfotransferase domain-containing protein n=1 Tax=Cylindrotheca closterium TaxID=2856 RepID=A0AAD2PVA5_9STRA|nr:unnamed protein product [Cylindrotheca closterium]
MTTTPLPEMPLLPITSVETVEACRDLNVLKGDVFVCSYPKSGTTWTQNLVCRLLVENVGMELPEDWHLSHSAPFYEVDQYWKKKDRVPPETPIAGIDKESGHQMSFRVFNTHLRPHQLPPNARCVYVIRDELDVLASFFYHLSNMAVADGGYEGTESQFCLDFLDGTVLYGRWQDHMEAWLGKTNKNPNIIILHYEDMKSDLEREATKLAQFLGVETTRVSEVVKSAIDQCTFAAMKKERVRYTPKSVYWKKDADGKPYDNFVRAGRVGDGKEFANKYFSDDLQQRRKRDRETSARRWRNAGVDPAIIDRYLL